MSDSNFHESMRQGITCSFFFICLFVFVAGSYFCFPQDERDGISFIAITSVDVGKS